MSLRLNAALLGGMIFLLLLTEVALAVAARDLRLINDGAALILDFAVLVVGVVIARNRPRNPMGWLAIGVALVLVVEGDAGLYSVLANHVDDGRLAFGKVAVFLADTSWVLAFTLFPLMILLFPDGRLPSARWRGLLYAYLVAVALTLASEYTQEIALIRGPVTISDVTGQSLNSVGVGGVSGWISDVGNVAAFTLPLFWVAFVARQVIAWRGATGEERQQLKWLMGGATVTVLSGVAQFITFDVLPSGLAQHALQIITELGITALPIAVAVGILKYRLYEIDTIIRRTLVYAALVAMLALLYLGGIFVIGRGLQAVTGQSSAFAVTASTLAVAVAFQPLRRRIQHVVDRRFYRAKYDVEHVLLGFSGTLRDQIDLDALQSEVLGVVHTAVQPRHASLWLRAAQPRE